LLTALVCCGNSVGL